MRAWITANVPAPSGKPIWITEVGSHWAYKSWQVKDGTLTIGASLDWEADFLSDDIERCMTSLINWLRTNSASLNIERWLFFAAYINLREHITSDACAGLYLFQTGDAAAPNRLGQLYRDYALGRRWTLALRRWRSRPSLIRVFCGPLERRLRP